MNNLRNRVQLIGNIGATPEIKTLENGTKLAKITVATNEIFKNQHGEKIKETQWHNCVAWGNPAKVIEDYCEKGKEICVEGKLTSRSYEDKSGNKKYVTEVVINEILLLGKK